MTKFLAFTNFDPSRPDSPGVDEIVRVDRIQLISAYGTHRGQEYAELTILDREEKQISVFIVGTVKAIAEALEAASVLKPWKGN